MRYSCMKWNYVSGKGKLRAKIILIKTLTHKWVYDSRMVELLAIFSVILENARRRCHGIMFLKSVFILNISVHIFDFYMYSLIIFV